MLAAIPVTLMISRYFLRMHRYLVDGHTPDDEVRGELEARMKQEKHLKEHILQQSREARCLVMSFDTLEAPPALPAVSVDSGSHDLARIIPTSLVRRIGVDDPKLPTGKESPFRQMVAPKPAAPISLLRPLRSALFLSGFEDSDDSSSTVTQHTSPTKGSKPPEEKKPTTTNAESVNKGKTSSTKAEVEKEKKTTANAKVESAEKGKKT
ncbi:hypothetical protein MTO96_004672 [Rhipicephalus appendiculatus]